MSNFSVGDAVCVIPSINRPSVYRKCWEGKKLKISEVFDGGCLFEVEEIEMVLFEADKIIHWDAATPAQRAGLCEGDKAQVLSGNGAFEEGEIVTLWDGDHSSCPWFLKEDQSGYWSIWVEHVERLLDEPEEEGEELSPEEEATDWMNSQMYDRDCRLPSTREQAFADKLEAKQQLEINEALIEQSRIQKRNSAVITAMGFNNQPVSKNGK